MNPFYRKEPIMRIRILTIVSGLLLAVVPTFAMDGVCIATIYPAPTYKWEATFGTLVKYEIRNSAVVKVDSLRIFDGASPRVNMSGTYYAYLKGAFGQAKTIVIKPLYGNPDSSRQFSLQKAACWVFWLNNGSFLYTTAGGEREVRKVTLGKANGNLTVTDRCWAKLPYSIQGGFVGIDGNATRIISMDGLDVHANLMTGDTVNALAPAWPGGVGCGYAVSPSGTYFTQWPGSHNIWAWNRWDGVDMAPGYGGQFFKTFVDSGWYVAGPNDPEGKLEVFTNGEWRKDPIGLMGADNNWSQNSEYWYMSEVGAGILEGGDGDCFNAIAVSWKERKAINISKIMPVSEIMSSRSTFRGIAFTGATQRSADRPTLWCSSKADVWDSLWHYVENRQADNQYWSDLLGLPLSSIDASPSVMPKIHWPESDKAFSPRISIDHQITLPGIGRFSITIVDAAGRQIYRLTKEGGRCSIPQLKAGSYCVNIRQGGHSYISRIVHQ